MTLTIRPGHAYAFLSALIIGKFTNIAGDIMISGLVLYIVTPEIYTQSRLQQVKNYIWSWFPPRNLPTTIKTIENDNSTFQFPSSLKIEEVHHCN